MERMRYLVVGYGNLGRRRARLLADRCVATVDPIAPEAEHRKLDAVDPSSYDAVVLATPDMDKIAYLRAFLELGKSVLVEKPLLFETLTEGEDLAARAKNGAVWQTAYNFRFEPMIQRLIELLASGAIGDMDRIRLRYGNGAVREWIGTWRERTLGVLQDLACHLIDLGPLLGIRSDAFTLLDARSIESSTLDHVLFITSDRRGLFEVGNVFWKNTFEIDIYGSAGSLHMKGLGKWDGAVLTRYERVLPSGAPRTLVERLPPGDPTWERDLAEFERRASMGEHSLANDWRISCAIRSLAEQSTAMPRLGAQLDATHTGSTP